jgi:hypothetical protein
VNVVGRRYDSLSKARLGQLDVALQFSLGLV